MQKTPQQALSEALKLAKEAESDANSAKIHSQSDPSYTWSKAGSAEDKLDKIQKILKLVIKELQ